MSTSTYTGAAPGTTAYDSRTRIAQIDMLRGLVIVLMALDHVRDYFLGGPGMAGVGGNLLDPTVTTPALYATRWITHLCAPTFVFLSGVSAYLQFANGKTTPNLSRFLFTRGLWLIFLEITVLSFGWNFGFPYPFFLQVIWAIGWCMLALAALVWLPRVAVLAIGVVITLGHNLLDPIDARELTGLAQTLWIFLHDGGPLFVGAEPIGLFAYPILPWLGIAALGYGLGDVFADQSEKRDRNILFIGLGFLAAFLVLRLAMVYGDPAFATGPESVWRDWRLQTSAGAMLMVFLDVQKYPPSLQFTLVTLGVVLTLWPLLTRLPGVAQSVLNTFGAVPFFFYLLHVYLIHLLAIAANAAVDNDVSGLFNYMINVFTAPEKLAGIGFGLPWVYLAWVVVLALLYPLCRYWQGLKQRRRDWWLSYL